MTDRIGGYRRPTDTTFISDSWQGHRDRKPTPSTEPGVDYGCAYGTTLYAPEDGRVVDVKGSNSGLTGRYITIDLNDGQRVRFLHLSVIGVSIGQGVTRGQVIGKTGASANGNDWGVGAHVHTTLWAHQAYTFGRDATINFEAYVGDDNDDGGTPGRAGYADGSAELRSFQEKLIRMGHDLGPTGADAVYGPKTADATRFEQSMAVKNGYPGGALVEDGLPGPSTMGYLDWWLVGRFQNQGHTATVADLKSLPNTRGLQKVAKLYGYTGGLDNDFGGGSQGGIQKFLDRSYGGSLTAWLRAKWGYAGNDIWGPDMAAAATRADTANWSAL